MKYIELSKLLNSRKTPRKVRNILQNPMTNAEQTEERIKKR